MKVDILIGLPGCGKELYLSHELSRDFTNTIYTKDNLFFSEVRDSINRLDDLIIVTDVFDEEFLKENLFSQLDGTIDYPDYVDIHFWEDDREICKQNVLDSDTISLIDVLDVYIPDINMLSEIYPNLIFSFETHTTELLERFILFAKEYNINMVTNDMGKLGYLESKSWVTGGSHWGCYTEPSPISAEDPVIFQELIDLLLSINYKFELRDYKNILNSMVEIKNRCNYGYYSEEEVSFFSISIRDLYNYLLSVDLVKYY